MLAQRIPMIVFTSTILLFQTQSKAVLNSRWITLRNSSLSSFFSDLKENANTLIFPNLESGNIAYKLMQEFDDVEAIGPILIGMKKPVHILQLGCSVREIVNMVTIAVIDAQTKRIWLHTFKEN